MRNYDNLICPRCGCRLSRQGGSLYCFGKHCYDIASSGYVNLVLSGSKAQTNSGDNKDMMQARRRVMDSGYYAKLGDELINLIESYLHDSVLDIGCGEGYITGRIARAFENSDVRGSDLSKIAIMMADKRYKNASFIVGNSASLPIAEGSVDVAVAVFTPAYFAELDRVLKRGGVFIKIAPGANHLMGVKELLYEDTYENAQTVEMLPDSLTLTKHFTIEDSYTAEGGLVLDLLQMTPYYYKTPKEAIERVAKMPKVTTELAFDIKVYVKHGA